MESKARDFEIRVIGLKYPSNSTHQYTIGSDYYSA